MIAAGLQVRKVAVGFLIDENSLPANRREGYWRGRGDGGEVKGKRRGAAVGQEPGGESTCPSLNSMMVKAPP